MSTGRERRRPLLLAQAAALCLLALAASRGREARADAVPPGRNKPAFAFDTTRKALVLFGGFGKGPAVLDDGWVRIDERWQPLERTAFPPRAAAGVASDSRRGRVVLFGGEDDAGICGDTLEWDGKVWKRVAWSGPPARTVASMAYDSKRGRTVLFGGHDEQQRTLGDTWEWDGARWTKAADAGPEARYQHVMTYSAARGRVVLFGGNRASGQSNMEALKAGLLGDTWEWDGGRWTLASSAGPARRDHHAMAYDELREKVVLFGGWDGTSFLGDIWEWDGSWKSLEARGPSARGGLPSMHYDPIGKSVVLHGGWSDEGPETDTWRWDGRAWTRAE